MFPNFPNINLWLVLYSRLQYFQKFYCSYFVTSPQYTMSTLLSVYWSIFCIVSHIPLQIMPLQICNWSYMPKRKLVCLHSCHLGITVSHYGRALRPCLKSLSEVRALRERTTYATPRRSRPMITPYDHSLWAHSMITPFERTLWSFPMGSLWPFPMGSLWHDRSIHDYDPAQIAYPSTEIRATAWAGQGKMK